MFEQCVVRLILATFFFTSIGPLPDVWAQTVFDLPAPGLMVNKSGPYQPLQLKGILVNIKNPLRFDFLVDKGDAGLYGQPLKDEIIRSAKYFLTCLAVPEDDLWVNLSPYEKDRIVPGNFGITLMGKDLLEQDYLLKQIMASLSYPENDLGKRFWQKVYRKSYELYGTTEIPINTFNKVWIIPQSAEVYVQGNSAFVVNSRLDVMLEADYKAFVHHERSQGSSQRAGAYSQVFREVILPELRQEINEGKNFAVVRQVYNAMILATWYKRHLKDSLLGKMYVGRNQVKGVDIADKDAKEKIFQQYLKAYKKCVYNYIKEDFDPFTQQTVPRKYASGGMYFAGFGGPDSVYREKPNPRGMKIGTDLAMATVDVSATNSNGEMVRFPFWKAEITDTHPFHQLPLEVNSPPSRGPLYDRAMSVPNFFRALILPVVLAAGGLFMSPKMVSAAQPFTVETEYPANLDTQALNNPLDLPFFDYKKNLITPLPDFNTSLQEISNQMLPAAIGSGVLNMPLSDAIGNSVRETESSAQLDMDLLSAQQKKADALEKGTVRLYLEGGAEANPMLTYIGLALEFRTPLLTHPTKAHDDREQPMDDAFAKAAKEIRIRENVFNLITAVKEYAAINEHIQRLESVDQMGLADEIAQANEDKRHQLALITSMLVIPLKDLPAGSNIVITDAQMDLGHIESVLNQQGVQGLPQARLAGISFEKSVEGVRGNLEVSERSKFKKAAPSHLTVHINPTRGSTGGGLVGWLISFVTAEWKVYPSFDAPAQADQIKEASAVWQDARLTIYKQLKQTLMDLRKDQVGLKEAKELWENRGDESDTEKLAQMSVKILDLQQKVAAEQLKAVKMGVGAALLENTDATSEESLLNDGQQVVEGAFRQGVKDMQGQVQTWIEKLAANHKDLKNVPVVLEAVNGIAASMEMPLKEEDISGMPVTDATGGAKASGAHFSLGLPSPVVAYTTGMSSNSPDAPTFITKLNEGSSLSPVFNKGGSKEAKEWQTQMNFAQEQFAKAQHGEGEGPKEYRQAIYGYLTSSIAQEIVSEGQGFNFTQMLMHLRSSTSYDSYSVYSLPSVDPMHWIMKGISKLKAHAPQEEASVITAKALTEELKMQAKEEMLEARLDTAKGPRWQAWDSFFNGHTPFISMTDSKGNNFTEFIGLLENLREELKPLWEKGQTPGEEPLDLRIMNLHLQTAEKLSSYGPDAVSYWTAPVVVWVGDITGQNPWEGLRGGLTIDRADKQRAERDSLMQISQLKQNVYELERKWQHDQAGVEAELAAGRAEEKILSRQPEDVPLIVEAPQSQRLEIANAVAAGQPIIKELQQIKMQSKDPRSIAVNILASVQAHPAFAVESLGGISVPLTDWVHSARIEEVKAWTNKIEHQAQVESIAATRQVMDLFAQEQFDQGAFKRADTVFKEEFAQWQAVNQANVEGLYSQSELDHVTQTLEHAKINYHSSRSHLETDARRLTSVISVLSAPGLKTFEINRIPLATASIPNINLPSQDPVDFTARLLDREFVGPIEQGILEPIRSVLTAANLTPQQLQTAVSAVHQVGGSLLVDNPLPVRQQVLLDELPRAITFIQTGTIPQAGLKSSGPTLPAEIQQRLPEAVTILSTQTATANLTGTVQAAHVPNSVLVPQVPFTQNTPQNNSSANSSVSAGGPPSPPPPPPEDINSEILKHLKMAWPWYTGLAVFGIGLAWGAAVLKRDQLKGTRPAIANRNISKSNLPGPASSQSAASGFHVAESETAPLPDAIEEAWIKEQNNDQAQTAQPLPAVNLTTTATLDNQPVISSLRVMDVLGPSLATALAAITSGDIRVTGLAFLVSFFATRLMYAGQLWFHESGHTLTALVQSPKDYKKILTWRNIFGNYSPKDWLRAAIPFLKPSSAAGVDVPLTGKDRRLNQAAGFAISSAVSLLALWLAARTGLWQPLLVSLGVSSLFVFYNSLMSDVLDPSSDGKIECGDSGFIWLTKIFESNEFFPQAFQEGQNNMRVISALRGDQGEGIFTWGETTQGDIVPIIFKSMKSKRGKPVTLVVQLGFKEATNNALAQGIRPLSGAVREIMTHDRFLTQGAPSQEGLHAHLGVIEKRRLCLYKDGEYQNALRTSVTVIIENGDNDAHLKHGELMPTRRFREFYPVKFHMKKTVYIAPNAENPHGYYDYLPLGDAPPLALEEQWYDNQGDWWASSRFALDEIFYESQEESMEQNLSEDEEDVMGAFFMNAYENGHEQKLIRPKLQKKNKTLKDSWVTQEMVENNPSLGFQYNELESFREDLKKGLLEQAAKASADENASAVGRILNRLQALHPEGDFEKKLDRFVDMAVERFFTADIFEAARQIDELTLGTGTYGVRILNSKYPGRGIFWTRGQSIAIGENLEAGYMVYNSEHTALMGDFGDAPPLKDILFLNSEGKGQLTETYYDNERNQLVLRAYSPEKGRFLTEDELKEWRMELGPDNEYWSPLVARDPDHVADEDIDDIPRAIKDAQEKWQDPDSFVRRSAVVLFDKTASRFVERYIKDNSRYYKVMQGNLLYAIDQLAGECQAGQCSDGQSIEAAGARRALLLRAVQHDPRILPFLKSFLDRIVSYQADWLSQEIVDGQIKEDDLFPQLVIVDRELSEAMTRGIQRLAKSLIDNNLDFLTNFENEQRQINDSQREMELKLEGKDIPKKESIGSGEADFFIAGMEDSLWIGSEGLKAMMLPFFPKMVIETDSSNKALDLRPNDRHQVGRRTIFLDVSKSGASSSSKNLIPIVKSITPGNAFVMTGRVDTLMGLALGQRYYKGAPFSKRIFPTGNYYPSEVNSISEVELLVNQIEMVLYLVRRMKEIFPHQRPWGMDVSDKNIKKLEEWQDKILMKAEHLTGVDENANPVEYRENRDILHNGQIFGKMLAETPLANLGNRAYVFSIIYLGTPIGAAAAFLEHVTGLSVHSSGLGHLIWAALDTTIACSMPWWITTGYYRNFSGRIQQWARLGPPKVVIGDIPVLNQVIENSASKRGAMAISTMDADFHGGNAQDHFGARYGHRVRRGTVEIFGLPEDPDALSHVLMTASQSNIRTDMSFGNKIWDYLFGKRYKAGPEIFTIGHGETDPNISQHHMNIGPLETMIVNSDGLRQPRADVTETIGHFYSHSFEVLDRLIAYNVFFNEAYRWATQWGKIRVWKYWESFSRTGVHSTPSPRSGPRKKLPAYHDADHSYSITDKLQTTVEDFFDGKSVDPAQAVTRHGGIDMNSRLMQLNITGDTQNRTGITDNAMSSAVINGVVPKVSEIVPVTPDMLKSMLGE